MAALMDPYKQQDFDAYKNLTPFNHYFLSAYLGATFQFDVAALWPGDWHHIVFLVDWKNEYTALTGVEKGEIWKWQNSGNRANGWTYTTNFVLGYQMPIVLSLVGLNAEITGHYRVS